MMWEYYNYKPAIRNEQNFNPFFFSGLLLQQYIVHAYVNKQTNKRMNEQTNERTNKQTNKRTNEQTIELLI